jgi:hypothetical protein
MLKITHNGGFFSCCSIRLLRIIDFYNKYKKLPDIVDSSEQFLIYKKENINDDITFSYFEHYSNINFPENIYKFINTNDNEKQLGEISGSIEINTLNGLDKDNYTYIEYNTDSIIRKEPQFLPYNEIDFNIIPFIKKYFTPSKNIYDIINKIEEKYNIDYSNLCVLFYRGNDKICETLIESYENFLIKANQIKNKEPNIRFLIQSDEIEFYEFMLKEFPDSLFFKDEIRTINKNITMSVDKINTNVNNEFSKYFLAIIIIMSKCKYIICGSGNCDIWIIHYRGNTQNVFQSLNLKWIDNLNL